ncbi:Calcium-transporting ATPase [Propionicimonas sp. T2.31MG-18]|uniref:cation-translocating P-type ATPase n=1 Tax=Propionicimonas sp. T2.31MG-18 TaxID=3157620 RepID=UPI0035E87512
MELVPLVLNEPARPRPWHVLSATEALEELGTSPRGLTDEEARVRLDRLGPNALIDRGTKSPWKILWEQLTAVMVVILLAAAGFSLLLGKFLEAGAIGLIVLLFALLGFLQEYRAERAIAALRQMTVPFVRAVRGGQVGQLAATNLVPGDIIQLAAGAVVPADLRLLETVALKIQEAALTGESEAVEKTSDPVTQVDSPLGDRLNVAYSGTQVAHGRGVGVVVATGMATELGKIADLLQGVRTERTPLQQRLDSVGKQLAVVGLVTAGVVAGLGALAGETWSDLVLTAISVAVAVIPEGLPAVVTFTLAVGAQRMLRREALIRKLPAVETLGSVTVICSDKTGTLTQNRMSVARLAIPGEPEWVPGHGIPSPTASMALVAGVLCNDSEVRCVDGETKLIGDPTETCLLEAASVAGLDVAGLGSALPRIAELPFDSERKRMSTRHRRDDVTVFADVDGDLVFVKGAVDGMLTHLSSVWLTGNPHPFDDTGRAWVESTNATLASAGHRVLCLAFRTIEIGADADLEDGLTLLGLVGIIDPPRPEVAEAVTKCETAGIRPVMITGDHPLTARAIAQQIGIGRDGVVLTGVELDRLAGEEFDHAARTVSVFARVAPEHKLRLVDALQRDGQIVAMTGDGVNDAPALKKSDIGVAMGITGTDVSKEASDMVLRDDNFATIISAVEEGRVIYDNLRRFVSFAVAGNLGKILVMVGWPIPYLFTDLDTTAAVALLPLQLLWLNLMTDGLLGLAMGKEPAEPDVMRRPPHVPGGSLWAGGLGLHTAWIGFLIGAIALAVAIGYHEAGNPAWQSMLFTTLAFLQVGQAFAIRSFRDSLWKVGLWTNPLLLTIAGVVLSLQLAALYTPLGDFLQVQPLAPADLLVAAAAGVGLFTVIEVVKALTRAPLTFRGSHA